MDNGEIDYSNVIPENLKNVLENNPFVKQALMLE